MIPLLYQLSYAAPKMVDKHTGLSMPCQEKLFRLKTLLFLLDPLHFLFLRLAANAVAGQGVYLKTLEGDLIAAFLAQAVGASLQFEKCIGDVLELLVLHLDQRKIYPHVDIEHGLVRDIHGCVNLLSGLPNQEAPHL